MNENGRYAPWMTLTGNVISSGFGTIDELRPIYIDGEEDLNEEYLDEEYKPLGPLRLEDIMVDVTFNWTFKNGNGIYFGDAGHEEPNDFPVGDTREMDDFFNSLEVKS